MPISISSAEPDTYSLLSQATSTLTLESLPDQLVRKTARKGFTFNIMLVGEPGMGKTSLLSALFGKKLEIPKSYERKDRLNPPITIASKTFDIKDQKVRMSLNIAKSEDYSYALDLTDTHLPLVEYIDKQFADYHRRESDEDRRNIRDTMIHCLFLFVSPFGHGLTKFDLVFLRSVCDRVNIVPIIARAEGFTASEKAAFKRRLKDDLKRHNIKVYQMSDPDLEDPDDVKQTIKLIQEAMPFAISSMTLRPDNTVEGRHLESGYVDPYNLDHSDYLLLKRMLQMQITDLCEITHEKYYEEYRKKQMKTCRCKVKPIVPPKSEILRTPNKLSTHL